MENFPDKISPMTLAAAIALGEGGGGQPTGTVYYPAGSIPFLSLPALTLSRVGAVYDITDDFTSSSDFTDGGGKDYLAGTDVAIVNTGTAENPVLKYNCLTNAINEIVDQAKITTTATGSDLTLSTAEGNLNALTVYGKSEVVDGAIVSAGEGWATVDLGTLTCQKISTDEWIIFTVSVPGIVVPQQLVDRTKGLLCDRYPVSSQGAYTYMDDKSIMRNAGFLIIKDSRYETADALKTSLFGVILAYELADPTQGNALSVKTDNGTGIDGTMAVFTTGTPLRSIPDTTVRDVMAWDGSAGEVTKNCGSGKLSDFNWAYNSSGSTDTFSAFSASTNNIKMPISRSVPINILTPNFTTIPQDGTTPKVYDINALVQFNSVIIRVPTTITTVEELIASYGNDPIVYELATPTTEQLTTAENTSLAGLRTFQPQTHAQNNAGAEMTVEAYAGTENGKAVQELKQGVQSEISALKITQSGTLTLTVADWSNNAQTIAYAHDTAKRNVIDVDPSSVEEWAGCGVLATAETASGITFTCKTVPENALTFRVTSMGVN